MTNKSGDELTTDVLSCFLFIKSNNQSEIEQTNKEIRQAVFCQYSLPHVYSSKLFTYEKIIQQKIYFANGLIKVHTYISAQQGTQEITWMRVKKITVWYVSLVRSRGDYFVPYRSANLAISRRETFFFFFLFLPPQVLSSWGGRLRKLSVCLQHVVSSREIVSYYITRILLCLSICSGERCPSA